MNQGWCTYCAFPQRADKNAPHGIYVPFNETINLKRYKEILPRQSTPIMDVIILSNACHKVNGSILLGGISAGEECGFLCKKFDFQKKRIFSLHFWMNPFTIYEKVCIITAYHHFAEVQHEKTGGKKRCPLHGLPELRAGLLGGIL